MIFEDIDNFSKNTNPVTSGGCFIRGDELFNHSIVLGRGHSKELRTIYWIVETKFGEWYDIDPQSIVQIQNHVHYCIEIRFKAKSKVIPHYTEALEAFIESL